MSSDKEDSFKQVLEDLEKYEEGISEKRSSKSLKCCAGRN